MPFSNSLEFPKSVVGVFPTKQGQQYSATYNFPKDASGEQPVMAGMLISHNNVTNWDYVAKEWNMQSDKEPVPVFSGDGEDLYSVFFLNCELVAGDNNKLWIGYGDAEEGSNAGTLGISKAQGNEANPPSIQTQVVPLRNGVNEKIGYPFNYNLFDWGANEGYNGTVKISILTPLEKSVVVCVFGSDGSLLGLFDDTRKSDLYISVDSPKWICSFLKAEDKGNGKFDFTIGDSRKDGSMVIEEL